ncbi:MAG: NAD-dependent epimerase/dehydratase family protein [Sphingorhabdus sp.]
MSSDLTLVTGVTGTIGSALVSELLEQGRPVRCLVRDVAKAEEMRLGVAEFVKGDLTNKASIADAFQDVTHVFHAGGMPEQWAADDSIFDRVNVGGTRHMVDVALTCGVKSFVYTSTQDMFDLTADPFDETMPGKVPLHSAYERSKQKAEAIVARAVAGGLPAKFVHPVAVYGPGAAEVSGLNNLLNDLLCNKVPILLNGGLPVVYNHDLAKGQLLVEAQAMPGDHYIFSDSYQSLIDIAQGVQNIEPEASIPKVMPDILAGLIAGTGELISKITGSKPPISKGELGVLQRAGRPSSAKARSKLGWSSRSFEDGLAEALTWLKERNR